MDKNIINYLDELVANQDLIAIEIMYNYALWLYPLSYSNYLEQAIKNNKFKSLFRSVIGRSLKIKYVNLTDGGFRKNFNTFIDFEILFG